MTLTEKQTDDFLSNIDKFCLDYNKYDFGLPIHDDQAKNELRNIVINFVGNLQKSEQTIEHRKDDGRSSSR